MPRKVGGVKLADSVVSSGETIFTYKGRNITALDVFVYPPVAADTSDGTVREELRSEAKGFQDGLSAGITQGWYEEYQVAFDAEKPVQTGDGLVPGFMVAAVLLRGGRTSVSLFYIYFLRGVFIKIRLTIPDVRWSTNPALNFPTELIHLVAKS